MGVTIGMSRIKATIVYPHPFNNSINPGLVYTGYTGFWYEIRQLAAHRSIFDTCNITKKYFLLLQRD